MVLSHRRDHRHSHCHFCVVHFLSVSFGLQYHISNLRLVILVLCLPNIFIAGRLDGFFVCLLDILPIRIFDTFLIYFLFKLDICALNIDIYQHYLLHALYHLLYSIDFYIYQHYILHAPIIKHSSRNILLHVLNCFCFCFCIRDLHRSVLILHLQSHGPKQRRSLLRTNRPNLLRQPHYHLRRPERRHRHSRFPSNPLRSRRLPSSQSRRQLRHRHRKPDCSRRVRPARLCHRRLRRPGRPMPD